MMLFNFSIAICASIAIGLGLTENHLLFSIFKPATTILIILALIAHRQHLPGQIFRVFVVALLACLAGDVLLLDDARFVAGLAAFLLAHLLLVRVFALLGGWSWSISPLIFLLLASGIYFWYLKPHLNEFIVPVAVYSLVIVVMAWQGISLSLKSSSRSRLMLFCGALLFMFSDAIIALNKFVVPFDLSVMVILASYWLSLTLILNGVFSIAAENKDSI